MNYPKDEYDDLWADLCQGATIFIGGMVVGMGLCYWFGGW